MKIRIPIVGVSVRRVASAFPARWQRLLLAGLFAGAASATAVAGSVVYEYDALGRLTKATYNNTVVIVYAYDAAGNRTTYTITGAP